MITMANIARPKGNTLAGLGVVEGMVRAFQDTRTPLAERLAALQAGQTAGDQRNQQSAALLVKQASGGYGGFDDRYVEISVCDHPTPRRTRTIVRHPPADLPAQRSR